MNKNMIIIIIIILIFTGAYFSSTMQTSTLSYSTNNPDTFSTSGPSAPSIPSTNKYTGGLGLSVTGHGTTLNVPVYDWYRGCGPTSVGMLFGYYDVNYDTDFLEGDANTQSYVLGSIASGQHYADYSMPIESTPMPIPDKSETGVPHMDNSIADFLGTSISKDGLIFGWGYVSKVVTGIEDYASFRGYQMDAQYYDGFTLDDFKHEIDEGRPFIAFLNADGQLGADHFVTVIGYDKDEFIFHSTWASSPTITTPLLAPQEQFGVAGIILTTNPVNGEGGAIVNSTPGFEIMTLISSIVGCIYLIKRGKKL